MANVLLLTPDPKLRDNLKAGEFVRRKNSGHKGSSKGEDMPDSGASKASALQGASIAELRNALRAAKGEQDSHKGQGKGKRTYLNYF